MKTNQSEQNEQKNASVKNFLCSPAGKGVLILIFYLVIFGLFLLCASIFENAEYVALIFVAVFAYFGWKALNRITPDMFLFMPIAGWILYFAIKFFLAAFIGIFIAPFVISKKIVETIQANIE